jgi:DNA-directed RNA polymerase beta subunit
MATEDKSRNESFNKDTWSVIETYFGQNQGEAVVKYVLDSFNDFVHRKLDQIIEGFNPINIYYKYMPEKDMFEYQLTMEIHNPILTKPMIHEKDGSTKMMTPNDARQRNFTYAGTLFVDVDFIAAVVKDGAIHQERKTIKKVNIGKIPIMLHSNYCILKEPWYQNQHRKEECAYDYGGYFIVNGNEKVIVSQDRISENKTYVFLDNKLSSYSHVAEIRSVPSATFGPPKLTSLKLSIKPNTFGRYIRVSIHHIRQDVPICVLFRALGMTSDKEIIEHIVYDLATPLAQKIANEMKGSIDEGSCVNTPNQALEYLSRYLNISGYPKEILQSREHRLNIIRNILRDEFLPHVGEEYSKKALYLGYMVNRMFKAYFKLTPLDDRDSYINKRVDTPGVLMANLFRQYYGKLVRDMKALVNKEVHSGPWKANNDFLNVVNTNNIYKLLKSTTIESGLKYSLSTGNWGIRNNVNKTKQGVAQVLNRLTYNATLSHLRRINTPMEKTGKLIQPRKLHSTQWGIICPAETPEGSSVGLVKNLSMMSLITVASNPVLIKEYAKDLGVVFYETGGSLKAFAHHTHVLLNGNLVGVHEEPHEFFRAMKDLKTRGIINIYTSIVWDVVGNVISICSDGGRCVRPLYIVDEETRGIRVTPDVIAGIKKKHLGWNDLLTPQASHHAHKYGIKEPVVEYLDVEENNTMMLAMRYNDLFKEAAGATSATRYTHLEMHPSLILGVLASNIPFPEHNQAPRNCYQCIDSQEPVQMAVGPAKKMADLVVGDLVATFDPETMVVGRAHVTAVVLRPTDKRCLRITTVTGHSIVATEDHRFMTEEGWVEAGQLSLDSRVSVFVDAPEIKAHKRGEAVFAPVVSIIDVEAREIADISVESENQSFIAGGGTGVFGVHNCSMGKQAIGLYATNFRNRMDTLANVLNYPQKPLVSTKISRLVGANEMPSGINVIVAIATYTGYNQEDSILMNKSAVERGLFNSTFYRSYKENCVKNHSTGEEEVFCHPPVNNTKGAKPYNYDKLEEDGFVKENTYVEAGDVLIGKCMPQKINDTFVYKDNSVIVKNNEMGYIDRSGSHDRYFKNVNSDGYVFSKVRVRNFRSPVIGDKLACYTPDTDYLTTRGWVPVAELTLDDSVASMVDGALVYQKPTHLHKFDHKGPMYQLESNQVNLCVTPNHRMMVKTKDPKAKYKIMTAEEVHHKRLKYKKNVDVWEPKLGGSDMPQCLITNGEVITHFKVDDYVDGFGKAKTGITLDIDSWITLYGIYIAEGTISPYGVTYAAHKQRVKDALNKASRDAGVKITPHLSDGEYNVYYWGCTSVSRFIGMGHIAITKRLMSWVWYLNRDQCQKLIHAMCLGDGGLNVNENSATDTWRYYTASTGLADDLQRLCLHAGYSANKILKTEAGTSSMNYVTGQVITTNADYYNLSIIKSQNEPLVNKYMPKKPFQDDYIDYDGQVFCCTVPAGDGAVYVRRNGYPVWSFNSAHAQKGTVGMLYKQEDMPFTHEGIVPDIIINPHCIPSRMTMAQLMECIMGKACVNLGTVGDATPFNDVTVEEIARQLDVCGLERYGNEIMYNPRTGEQQPTAIFIGPTYYQRLKHMVADKSHSRNSNGPVVLLTRQPAEGRAREGGLRMGEMEVECNWAHGTLQFLKERLMECSDNYRVFVCSKCGMMANVNPDNNVRMCRSCQNNTDFVQLRIPYACKLLFQEVQCMGIGAKFGWTG